MLVLQFWVFQVLDCGVSVAGVRAAGVTAGVIADAGVKAGGADFVGPTSKA